MKTSIITIGNELLIGQVIDTNSAWLAGKLTETGFSVKSHASISDSEEDITTTLNNLLPETDLIIFTGGLGPTNDDITKKVLADYFDSGMILSDEVLSDVEKYISCAHSHMNKLNTDQALVPEKAKILRNNYGTAPGMWFEKDKHVVISLPGVPREMKGIYTDHIESELKTFFKTPNIYYKTMMLTGISESVLAEKLETWENNLPDSVSLAYLPAPGQIRLRLGAENFNKTEAISLVETEAEKLYKIVPEYIYGLDNESLEEAVGKLIQKQGKSLSTAESCTGGTISSRITSIPGCSAWFKGSVTAYSNEVKHNILGVKTETLNNFGAVSGETIEEMAKGVLKLLNTDYSVATSGIAGPDGGTETKPVGTVWIAAAGKLDNGDIILKKEKFVFGNNRQLNIDRSVKAALNMLRKLIINQTP